MWGEVYLAEEFAYAGIFYASIISSTMFFCSTIDIFFFWACAGMSCFILNH